MIAPKVANGRECGFLDQERHWSASARSSIVWVVSEVATVKETRFLTVLRGRVVIDLAAERD